MQTDGHHVRAMLPVLMAAAFLAACGQDSPPSSAPEVRPVRTATLEKRQSADPVVLTGRVQAQDEASFAFRIAGRMIERAVRTGDRVKAGDVLARLEPQNEQNALRAAKASLAAAQAQLTQARNQFERQETLLRQGWTTRVNFDQAEKGFRTAQSQVDAAEAQLKIAHDQVDFTELKADAPGVVTAVGSEPGEVVQAGQMIVRLARQGGLDAVFDVPAEVLRTAPSDPLIEVHLPDSPNVKATGRVREVAPQADPVTRTFEVKVGLSEPPSLMRLGATVTGTMQRDAISTLEIPASALTKIDRRPAVWIVDPESLTVSARNVEVLRFNPATVAISRGLDVGEIIVTAGVQALHPGQKIRMLGAAR